MKPQHRDLFTNRWRGERVRSLESNDLHIPLVSMLRWCVKDEVVWRHVPNGEHRDKRTAAKLKAMGVLAGGADLEFYWRDREQFRALFLELKLPGRHLSPPQYDFAKRIVVAGAFYCIAKSIDEALKALRIHGLLKPNVKVTGVHDRS